jgi:hypothetical protein
MINGGRPSRAGLVKIIMTSPYKAELEDKREKDKPTNEGTRLKCRKVSSPEVY